MSVIVIGAGVAGTAAAWSAKRHDAGSEVTIVTSGPGASEMGSGAIDLLPWEQAARAAAAIDVALPAAPIGDDARAFVEALQIWDVPRDRNAAVATLAGVVRPARGRDRALLDVAAIRESKVIVPRVDRAAWDADALAAWLSASAHAQKHKLVFEAVDAPLVRFEDEHRIGDGDLAMRHDDPDRLRWLADRLRDVLARHPGAGGVLVGPWLGASSPRAEALTALVGAPVGEALAGVSIAPGLRFAASRDRLLTSLGVRVAHARATKVASREGLIEVSLGEDNVISASSVVLAVGGIAGGGIAYAPLDREAGGDLPRDVHAPYALSLRADVALAPKIKSSIHGPELDLLAWPSADAPSDLEQAGVACDGERAGEGIWAAGDVVAGRPRTVLSAVIAAIRAGSAAAAR